MARDLAHQRCFNHAQREAVARCPECGHFFCRECIAEHEDRVVCAPCLAMLTRSAEGRVSRLRMVGQAAACLASVVMLWLLFYALGLGLLAMPSSFHEGTLWHVGTWGD